MKDRRIVFVTLHTDRPEQAVPLGAACVASCLKADQELSPQLDLVLLDARADEPPADIVARIVALQPDLAGFSLYLWNRDSTLACAKGLARRLPDCVLFCGGPEAGARPESLDRDSGGPFDCVIRGEGELATAAFLRAFLESAGQGRDAWLARMNGGRVQTAPSAADLNTLPSPWLDGTLAAAGRAGVLWELARGCPHACAYCYESKGLRRVRYFSEERLQRELEEFSRARVPVVHVLDPTFNAKGERAVALLDRILEKAPDTHWHFEARAEYLNRAQAKRFAQLGASVQIGLQSADEQVCARVGRTLKRGLFASKIALLNEEGVSFGLDLIYGLPGDRLSGFMSSMDFALSLYPDSLDLFPLAVLPGTELADRASEWGLEHQTEAPYLVQASAGFPPQDLARARRLSDAADIFYNLGRAVGWFNQLLYPLGDKPSRFLEGFADFLKLAAGNGVERQGLAALPSPLDDADPIALERLQLDYISRRYEEAELGYLLPAVWDIVRFHGAWSRALADGVSTTIDFNYDPEEVSGESAMDIEEYVSLASRSKCWAQIVATADGPRLERK